jgi:hypothetical protein
MTDLKVKGSLLPRDSSPTTTDYLFGVDAETNLTKQYLLADLLTLFFTQTTIPAGGASPVTRHSETMFDFVASGGVWTGDSYAVNRNASMSAMVCYINGRRISITAVSARTFTASKDTYSDVLDNGDGTGTLVYTEVTNNAASPALASNSLRIGIIVTGATTIASVAAINQGQEGKLLPIATSQPYEVTDSLGNLICSRDPDHRTLGYRQITASPSVTSTSDVAITGLSCPVIVPQSGLRKVKIRARTGGVTNTAISYNFLGIFFTSVTGANKLSGATWHADVAGGSQSPMDTDAEETPGAASRTYIAGMHVSGGTATPSAEAITAEHGPFFIRVELG